MEMPTELALASFGGVLVGSLAGMLTVVACLIGRTAIQMLDEYLWLAAQSYSLQTFE